MVVSAWAKRAVMLWSILPLLGLMLIERLFFGTHVIAGQLETRIGGYASQAFNYAPGAASWVTTSINNDTITAPSNIIHFIDIHGFLAAPQTWIGIIVGIALIVCAIQLRMRRTEI